MIDALAFTKNSMLSFAKSLEMCQEALKKQAQKQAGISDETVLFRRLNALLLVSSGMSCKEVAELYGTNVRTVQRWARNYQTEGVEGLKDQLKEGRPSTLSEQQWVSLKEDFAKGPVACGVAIKLVRNRPDLLNKQDLPVKFKLRRWSVPLLAEHLGRKYGASFSLRHCQRLILQLRAKKP